MNILYIALLFCAVCYVFVTEASSSARQALDKVSALENDPLVRQFREAIDEGRKETVRYIFRGGSDELREYCIKYLASLGNEKPLLIEYLKGVSSFLSDIMLYADEDLIRDVFKQVEPPNWELANAANSVGLACAPDKFVNLLEKITEKGYQKRAAIFFGVRTLFEANKIECVSPLLSALEGKESLDQDVKDTAIRKAFEHASKKAEDSRASSLARDYYDHPAVLAEDYSAALYWSYDKGGFQVKLFKWLLGRADLGDLDAVKKHPRWEIIFNDFKGAIKQALETPKPKGTRHRGRIERAILARETFSEVGNISTQGPGDVIAAYLVGDSGVKEVQKVEAEKRQGAKKGGKLTEKIIAKWKDMFK